MCKGLPEEVGKYLTYCKGIHFEEKPDYNYARGLFKQIMQQRGYDFDSRFDWMLKKEGRDDLLKALLKAEVPKANFGVEASAIVGGQ